ncbi:MAG: DnaJ domain-containing protein [Candidatus Thermoplasmatota archaeon]|nr:DnaJ domain-containing protein [Candidatus Thermoplasmatota archaeon]
MERLDKRYPSLSELQERRTIVKTSCVTIAFTIMYRELVRTHHPDRISMNGTDEEKENSHIAMSRINCAKEILLDADRRAMLDRYIDGK